MPSPRTLLPNCGRTTARTLGHSRGYDAKGPQASSQIWIKRNPGPELKAVVRRSATLLLDHARVTGKPSIIQVRFADNPETITRWLESEFRVQLLPWFAALWVYELAVQNYPQSAGAFNHLGTTYADLGRYEKAADSLREALRLDPKSDHVLQSRNRFAGRAESTRQRQF